MGVESDLRLIKGEKSKWIHLGNRTFDWEFLEFIEANPDKFPTLSSIDWNNRLYYYWCTENESGEREMVYYGSYGSEDEYGGLDGPFNHYGGNISWWQYDGVIREMKELRNITGVPKESVDIFCKGIEKAKKMGADSVSIYVT